MGIRATALRAQEALVAPTQAPKRLLGVRGHHEEVLQLYRALAKVRNELNIPGLETGVVHVEVCEKTTVEIVKLEEEKHPQRTHNYIFRVQLSPEDERHGHRREQDAQTVADSAQVRPEAVVRQLVYFHGILVLLEAV